MPVSVLTVLERLSRAPLGRPRPRVRTTPTPHGSPGRRQRRKGRQRQTRPARDVEILPEAANSHTIIPRSITEFRSMCSTRQLFVSFFLEHYLHPGIVCSMGSGAAACGLVTIRTTAVLCTVVLGGWVGWLLVHGSPTAAFLYCCCTVLPSCCTCGFVGGRWIGGWYLPA